MATLLRPWRTTYRLPDGTRVKKGTPGAAVHREQVDCWYGQYRDEHGKWQRVRLTPNKRAAESLLADLVRRADLRRAGLPAPDDGVRTLPWRTVVEEYLREIRSTGLCPKAYSSVERCVTRACEGVGARVIGDLTPDRLTRWFTEYRSGRAMRTWNEAVRQGKRFGRWLVDRKGLGRDPFKHLKEGNMSADRHRVRRDMDLETVERLLSHTLADTVDRRKLSPLDRYWLYRVALQTGYRAGELSHVRAVDVRDGGIYLDAKHTKNGSSAFQPLPQDTFTGLLAWAGGLKRPLLWPGTWYQRAAVMIGKDLQAAGCVVTDPRGRVLDFHALRHTYVTQLGRAGIPLKDVQTLARHSNPTLTLGTYSHTDAERLRESLGRAFSSTPAAQNPAREWLDKLGSSLHSPTIPPDVTLCQEDGF